MPRHLLPAILSLAVLGAVAARAENVALPPLENSDGLIARLLIAESLNPNLPGYDAAEVRRGMVAMKAVLRNRLRNNPGQFLAPKAQSVADIIAAPGQFHGFSRGEQGGVAIAADVARRIERIVAIANEGPSGPMAAFVQMAIEVAGQPPRDEFVGLETIDDVPVTGGVYGWRTAGSGGPGGRFLAIPKAHGGLLAGNQFYTLRRQ